MFGATVNHTGPDPFPLSPRVSVTHVAPPSTSVRHGQYVVTWNSPVPPSGPKLALVALNSTVHPRSCKAVNVCPATPIFPSRASYTLGATVNCTAPAPAPLVPEVIASQLSWLTADHWHPADVLTATDEAAPDFGNDCDVGEMLYEQPDAWLIVTDRPATVSVPDRAGPPLAGVTTCTVPDPLPVAPAVIVTHAALLPADHVQPAAVLTDTLDDPPPKGYESSPGETA